MELCSICRETDKELSLRIQRYILLTDITERYLVTCPRLIQYDVFAQYPSTSATTCNESDKHFHKTVIVDCSHKNTSISICIYQCLFLDDLLFSLSGFLSIYLRMYCSL